MLCKSYVNGAQTEKLKTNWEKNAHLQSFVSCFQGHKNQKVKKFYERFLKFKWFI